MSLAGVGPVVDGVPGFLDAQGADVRALVDLEFGVVVDLLTVLLPRDDRRRLTGRLAEQAGLLLLGHLDVLRSHRNLWGTWKGERGARKAEGYIGSFLRCYTEKINCYRKR